MLLLQSISADAKQKVTLVLPDGTSMLLRIRFMSQQDGWVIDELTRETLTIHGMRICVSPNLLHQYRNTMPFGLACFSKDNREPTQQEDFSSGAAKLYILTQAEVAYFQGVLTGEIQP